MSLPIIGQSSVPLLGQACRVHGQTGNISVVITCNCRPENEPMPIKGPDVAAMCEHCGGIFQIVHAVYDIREGTGGVPLIGVAMVGRAPTSEKTLA